MTSLAILRFRNILFVNNTKPREFVCIAVKKLAFMPAFLLSEGGQTVMTCLSVTMADKGTSHCSMGSAETCCSSWANPTNLGLV